MARPAIRRALPWAVLESGTTAFTAVLGLLILSRLLTPDDFGIVALAQSIVATVQLFTAMGIREAVIRHRPVDVSYYDTAHWLAVGLAFVGFALCSAIALWFVFVAHETLLGVVLAASAINIVFAGFNILPDALLGRKLRTAALARRTLLSKAVYTVLACGLAIAGWGLWSIVIATVLQTAVSTLTLWIAQPRLPNLRLRPSQARDILSYGWAVSADAALWSFASRAFIMMVGLVHGVTTVGYLNLAMRTTEVLSALLTAVNNRFSLPLFAHAQASLPRVRSIYARGTELLNAVSAPVFVGLCLTAPDWIPLFLGHKWLPAVGLVQAFSLAWVIVFTRMLVGDCVRVTGHPRALLPQAVLSATAMVGLVLLTRGHTMLSIAVAWGFARALIAAPWSMMLLRRFAGLTVAAQLKPLMRPALAVAAMTGAVFAVRHAMGWADAPQGHGLRLAADIAVGGAVYIAVAAMMFRREIGQFRTRLATT
jgi:O-antigen/teichoic acid export membrane protein